MAWLDRLTENPLPWLLEPDDANPTVRYFALRDLLDRPESDPEVRAARAAIMATGPVPAILAAQHPDGYWVKPGAGYSPKYQGTVWQIIFLGELGADPADPRVSLGCEYLLAHSRAKNGAFSYSSPPVPSATVHCLTGNLAYALFHLGHGEDGRLYQAIEWLAEAITGPAGFHYNNSGVCGPGFACSVNTGQPCGWGAAKAMKALLAIPQGERSPLVQQAIATGVEFFFSRDPAAADYPFTERVSSTWFKLGFPLSYWSDVLEVAQALAEAGCAGDPRLGNAVQFILAKADRQGRWKLENCLNGKTWADIEQKGKPSKWITLRALRLLKQLE